MSDLTRNLKQVYQDFQKIDISLEDLCTDWMYTLFASSLDFSSSVLVWDIYLLFGERIIFLFMSQALNRLLVSKPDSKETMTKTEYHIEMGSKAMKQMVNNLRVRLVWRDIFDDKIWNKWDKFYPSIK